MEGRRFADVSATLGADFLALGYHRGSAFGDLNNDGWLDIVVTGLNEKPRILLNSGTPGRNWIGFSLTGRKSNRDAIGAEIRVTTVSGRTLFNHVTASVGFMSSSDRRVHFGLGAEEVVEGVEIRWPAGGLQNLGAISVNRYHRIEEPE